MGMVVNPVLASLVWARADVSALSYAKGSISGFIGLLLLALIVLAVVAAVRASARAA